MLTFIDCLWSSEFLRRLAARTSESVVPEGPSKTEAGVLTTTFGISRIFENSFLATVGVVKVVVVDEVASSRTTLRRFAAWWSGACFRTLKKALRDFCWLILGAAKALTKATRCSWIRCWSQNKAYEERITEEKSSVRYHSKVRQGALTDEMLRSRVRVPDKKRLQKLFKCPKVAESLFKFDANNKSAARPNRFQFWGIFAI